jgi:hypothetical protein
MLIQIKANREKMSGNNLWIGSGDGHTAKHSSDNHIDEIANAMLKRQQATAIVAARLKIVEGAVSMVEMALADLLEKQIVDLDEEKSINGKQSHGDLVFRQRGYSSTEYRHLKCVER